MKEPSTFAWRALFFSIIQMKSIVCFGDSNTWGYNPKDGTRYPESIRWTGILQSELGSNIKVIEEGLNGRTSVWVDPIEAYPNGKDALIPCLDSHCPIDLIILLLGTNDLKAHFDKSPKAIAGGIRLLGELIQSSASGPDGAPPRLLLLAPPPLGHLGSLAERFKGGTEKSNQLGAHYQQVARELNCAFTDLGGKIQSSDQDGIHWEPEAHQTLGQHLAEKIIRNDLLT